MSDNYGSSVTLYQAASQLLADYARLIDSRDSEGWSELFEPQGELAVGDDLQVIGRPALADFAARSPVGVHVQGIPSIVANDRDVVECVSSWLFMNANTGQLLTGYYVDRLILWDSRLLFSLRRVESGGPTARKV